MSKMKSKRNEAENGNNRGYKLSFQGLFIIEREFENKEVRN